MGEKIEIHDPDIKRRVDAAIADLEKFYPDKKVYSLNRLHKGLCNRVGELWPQIGYESRDAFFAAYGFELVSGSFGGAGGRPITFDPEELFSELAARYEGLEKPSSIGILAYENPDLKASLKTFQNKSSELFGETPAKVLRRRGILSDAGRKSVEVTDDEIRVMLDALATKYAGASVKPSSMDELKAGNPEYKATIVAFSARGKMMYGMPPRKKLVELGIFPAPKSASAIAVVDASAVEIEGAIDELGEMLCDLPAEDKPKTIDALMEAYPKQGGFIGAGKKKGILDKAFLQELGILAPTKAMIKKDNIRKVASEKLLPLFIDAVGEICIEPGGGSAWRLPPYVVGIDVAKGVELREAIVSVGGNAAKAMTVGQTYPAEIFIATDCFEYSTVRILWQQPEQINGVRFAGIFKDAVKESASKLASFEGALVVSVSEFKGQYVAQLKFDYLAKLRSDTMIYVLRQMGIVTDADLLGGIGWRFRMYKAAKGAFEVSKPPKALNEADTSISAEDVRFGYPSKACLADFEEDRQTPHETGSVAYECSDKVGSKDSAEYAQTGNGSAGIADIKQEFSFDGAFRQPVGYSVSPKSDPSVVCAMRKLSKKG